MKRDEKLMLQITELPSTCIGFVVLESGDECVRARLAGELRIEFVGVGRNRRQHRTANRTKCSVVRRLVVTRWYIAPVLD